MQQLLGTPFKLSKKITWKWPIDVNLVPLGNYRRSKKNYIYKETAHS